MLPYFEQIFLVPWDQILNFLALRPNAGPTQTHSGNRCTPYDFLVHVDHVFFEDNFFVFQSILRRCAAMPLLNNWFIHGHLSNYFGQQSFPFLPEIIGKLSCPFPSFTFGQLSFPVPFHFQNFIGLSKTFPESPLISYFSGWVCLICISPFVNPFELNPW